MLRTLNKWPFLRVPWPQQKCAFLYPTVLARHRHLSSSADPAIGVADSIVTDSAAVTAAPAATAAGQSTSAIANFWESLSTSTPVAYMQQGLIEIHDFTGLPWWASIVVSTILFRSVVTLPLTIYQHKITARIEALTLEMPAIVAELKKEAAVAMKKFNWTEKQTRLVYNRSLRKQWNQLIIRDNCHPAKTLIVLWAQIPLWICQSVALRNLVQMRPDPMSIDAQVIYMQLTLGGFGWIPNLIEVDASYILPVALGLTNLAIIEIQAMTRKQPTTRLQYIVTNIFRVLSLAMVPIACSVPSALCVYWVASSGYGLAQNLLLLSPAIRRSVGIPPTKAEHEDPYGHLWCAIKVRTGLEESPKLAPANANANANAKDNNSDSDKDKDKDNSTIK